MKLAILLASITAVVLTGCETNPYTGEHRKAATGATIGAGSGALLGGIVAGSGDRTKGAVLGALIGATVGGVVGNQMDKQEAELRRSMEGTGVEVQREGDTLRLQAPSNITFATNRSDVRTEFMPVLDQLAGSINQYPGTVVRVEGHTDSVGTATYNQTLSENRAQSVRSYLIQRGVAPNRVEAVGYGLTRPVADNATADGRARNRRVEVLIVPVAQ